MFQLALRMWTENGMIYPTKFSVMYNPEDKTSSIRTFVKEARIISFEYMLITPFDAINGPIFEKDIVVVDEDDENLKIVDFDVNRGQYIAKSADGAEEIIMDKTHRYEVAGNIYEDRDLIYDEEPVVEEVPKEEEKKEEIPKPEEKVVEDKKPETPVVKEEKAPVVEPKKEPEVTAVEEKTVEKAEELKPAAPESKKPVEEKTVPEEKVVEPAKEKTNLEKQDIKEEKEVKKDIPVEEKKEPIKQEQKVEAPIVEEKKEFPAKKEVVKPEEKKPEIAPKKQEVIKPITELDIQETADKVENLIDEGSYTEEIEEDSILVNKTDKKLPVKIYFISQCSDTGRGGYSFSFDVAGQKDIYKGSEDDMNSKKMDLFGIVAALEMLDGKFDVTVYTTSQYVVYPFMKGWIHKWHGTNWYKNEKERIQNYELWAQLYEYYEKYNIKWEAVYDLTPEMKNCMKFAKEEARIR